MVNVPRHGRRRLHRIEFRPLGASPRIPTGSVTTLDKLTYAGRLREPARRRWTSPRHRFVKGDIADAAVAAPLVDDAEIVVHFAAETHVDRSIHGRRRVHPHRRLRHVRAARGRARRRTRCGASSRSRPTRSTAACPTGHSRETDELRPRNPYSASKAGADRLAYSYWATYGVPRDRHARVEQLRAEPVSGKSDPAVHHQRDRSPPAAALRRRPERARLAARRRPLPRDRPAHRRAARPARSTTSAAATR